MISSGIYYVTDIFWSCNDQIHLSCALARVGGGATEAHGLIEYGDGEKSYFHKPADNSKLVRRDLEALCEYIGQYYCADVKWSKLGRWISSEAFFHLLSKRSGEMQ